MRFFPYHIEYAIVRDDSNELARHLPDARSSIGTSEATLLISMHETWLSCIVCFQRPLYGCRPSLLLGGIEKFKSIVLKQSVIHL